MPKKREKKVEVGKVCLPSDYFGELDIDLILLPSEYFGKDQSLLAYTMDKEIIYRGGVFRVEYYKLLCQRTYCLAKEQVLKWKDSLNDEEVEISAIMVLNLKYPFCRRLAQDYAPEELPADIIEDYKLSKDRIIATLVGREELLKIISIFDGEAADKFTKASSIPVVVFDKDVIEVFVE